MTEAEACAAVRGYASANRYVISSHAQQRMRQRNVRHVDVYTALCGCAAARAQDQGRWKVTGPDADGDDLDLVVTIDDGVVVITLF